MPCQRLHVRDAEWVIGSRSMCLRPTEVEHINGNALYSMEKGFVENLRRELSKRMDTWAFDVLIGHWLFRRRPERIRSSPHVLSISTFQRNRSCCELVQAIVQDGGEESTSPNLFLLHTGNIGKLRDSAVPPTMRTLGLSLQDLFVPRSTEPCALESTLRPISRRVMLRRSCGVQAQGAGRLLPSQPKSDH